MGRTKAVISRCVAGAVGSLALSAVIMAWMAGGLELLPDAAAAAASARMGQGDSLSVKRERLLLYERSFRPSTYDAPLPRVLPAPGDSATEAAAGLSVRDTYAQPETVQGFRIQLLNTTSYDESSAMRNQLLAAFDTWWVYVLYEAPTYKVRIGDFATRLEAKNALEQIQARGFATAWLVPDKVVLHLPPRMPLASPIDTSLVK